MLCGTPPGMPPDRGVGLELRCDGRRSDAGSRPVTRRSDGELRAQLIGLLDRGWIQNSTAGHAAAMVFASKPDGSWHICYDCRGLHAITRPAVEPLPHIDALLDVSLLRQARPSSNHQLRARAADRWKTNFRSQLGRLEKNVWTFGLQGASALLTRVMNQALTVGLAYAGDPTTGPAPPAPRPGLPSIHGGFPGPRIHWAGARSYIWTIAWCTHRRWRCTCSTQRRGSRSSAASSRSPCEFRRQELGLLGHRLSAEGVPVDPHQEQPIVEWATPTSSSGQRRAEVRRFTGLATTTAASWRATRAAGGGPRPAGVPTLPAWRRGASAGGVLNGFRPADRQPGDHLAQEDPES